MPSMTNATVKILRALADRPEGEYAFRLKAQAGVASGTVYPILQRLEEEGWVESWWNGTGRTGQRLRFYEFTQLGRQKLYEREIL